MTADSKTLAEEYAALTAGAGFVELPGRTMIEVRGRDRAVLLHNLCTCDVKRLLPGQGGEAFFTDASGKILAFVSLFAGTEAMVMETVPGQGGFFIPYLDRYIFREDVQLTDHSSEWSELLLAGAQSAGLLAKVTGAAPPAEPLSHLTAIIAGCPVVVRRVMWTEQGGYLIQCDAAQVNEVTAALLSAGAISCSGEALEIARVEAGYPNFGTDITHENLPQEIDRDALAISFTKGCYIGQETVARIDALGHVNRKLRLVRFAGEAIPAPGTELLAGDKKAGQVTSAVYSLKLQAPLAIAFVRRNLDQPGQQLESAVGAAEVV